MLSSFFYIPAGNKKFFSALTKYKPDYFIIDLEDSISSTQLNEAVDFIVETEFECNIPIYLRLWDIKPETITQNPKLFNKFSNYVLPKVENITQIDAFISSLSKICNHNNFSFVLLFESPEGIINIDKILEFIKDKVLGIGFGSHDYCSLVRALHEPSYYFFPRNLLLLYGKKYNLICIDVASTDINNNNAFINDCIEGFNMGFDAKPILHPRQLEVLQQIKFYSDSEIEEAKELSLMYKGFIPQDISAIKFNGRIIEKPHIKRINRIIDYINKQ